jgi:hypothetical protein
VTEKFKEIGPVILKTIAKKYKDYFSSDYA